MSQRAIEALPQVFSTVELVGPTAVRRTETIRPGMCGPLQALVSTVGDWTWEAVSTVCGLNAFNARDPQGRPSYLAFYHYRIICGGALGPADLSFGDEIVVDSSVFAGGRLSVLTVHRIRRAGTPAPAPLTLEELHSRPLPGCLYVETTNVWLSRGSSGSNVGLVRSAPAEFAYAHLPPVPEPYDVTLDCRHARDHGTFPQAGAPSASASQDLFVEHPVDPIRDVNGVGLLYFASFFPMAERAQLHQWHARGLTSRQFLDRRLMEARICYLGNADLDTRLNISVRSTRNAGTPGEERCDLTIRDPGRDRTLAVVAFRHRIP
ncbi:LnmK family bifunctional acyltransferase/decarboxylase [Kitasatospora cineracea]|uniref:LnmK family bifunctional acyltransferase/decarboxylase n=1 Tax=Kitasatospora cineracea TaxID=88074 RepID=UPI0037948D92